MSAITFRYDAVTGAGVRRRGVTRAGSKAEAYRALVASGLTPVSIGEARAAGRGRSRVHARDVADFTRQLAVLISSRIPLAEGLRSIAEQEAGSGLAIIVEDIGRRVEAGERVADALAVHEPVFGRVYVRTVRAAEESGNLPGMLTYLADMLEHQRETRAQIRGALMYPICVTTVLALAVVFMLIFVVPRFGGLFAARGVELPAFTRGLLAFSGAMRASWWAILPGSITAGWAFRRFVRSERGGVALDRALHRVPHIGRTLRAIGVGRFARVLGVCVASGVSLIEAVRLAGEASGRPLMQADAARMAEQIRVGARLRTVLDSCAYLSPFARRMLGAGEDSGELPRMCEIIAREQEREAAGLLKNLGTVIEPVLIVLIAAAVLVIALAIFLPMWNMASLMGAS